ncbi:MAG: phosphoglycerate dehydrogenase [Terrimicrobiaceae bacterium]
MIRAIGSLGIEFSNRSATVFCPEFHQVMAEKDLLDLVPQYDGWIIGDDPATAAVLKAGVAGRLRAAIRWGIGTDNVDFPAAKACGLDIVNTPGMFNEEVSDVAIGYLLGLARDLFLIDRGVRAGGWPKPPGLSLMGKTAALVGFGNIGRSTARKLLAFGIDVIAYDPFFKTDPLLPVESALWPGRIEEADFLILTCALTPSSRHMVNRDILTKVKHGALLINVGRGPLIDEQALCAALQSGRIAAAALDVFQEEPLPTESPLRFFDRCIFGSHNSSNTVEAVQKTSIRAIELLFDRLAREA